jgi:hypothetical protein
MTFPDVTSPSLVTGVAPGGGTLYPSPGATPTYKLSRPTVRSDGSEPTEGDEPTMDDQTLSGPPSARVMCAEMAADLAAASQIIEQVRRTVALGVAEPTDGCVIRAKLDLLRQGVVSVQVDFNARAGVKCA